MTRRARTLTPEEFAGVLAEIPDRFKPLVMTAIETGLRWGELGSGLTEARQRAMADDVARPVAEALKAASDPIRVRVLSALATAPSGEVSAGELAAMTDVTAPTVSHHPGKNLSHVIYCTDEGGTVS